MAVYGLNPALGWVSRGGATLRSRRALSFALSVVVKARFRDDPGGTVIRCSSRLTLPTLATVGFIYAFSGEDHVIARQ